MENYSYKIQCEVDIPFLGKVHFLKNFFVDRIETELKQHLRFSKLVLNSPHLEGLHFLLDIPLYKRNDFLNLLYYLSDVAVSQTSEKVNLKRYSVDIRGFLQFYFLMTEIAHFPYHFTFSRWIKRNNEILNYIINLLKELIVDNLSKTLKVSISTIKTDIISERNFEYRNFLLWSLLIGDVIVHKLEDIKNTENTKSITYESFKSFYELFTKFILFQYVLNREENLKLFIERKLYKEIIKEKDGEKERDLWDNFAKTFFHTQRLIKRIRHLSTMFIDAPNLLKLLNPSKEKIIQFLMLGTDDIEISFIYRFLGDFFFSESLTSTYIDFVENQIEKKKINSLFNELSSKTSNEPDKFEKVLDQLYFLVLENFTLKTKSQIDKFPKFSYYINLVRSTTNKSQESANKLLEKICKLCFIKKDADIEEISQKIKEVSELIKSPPEPFKKNKTFKKLGIQLIFWLISEILKKDSNSTIDIEPSYRTLVIYKDNDNKKPHIYSFIKDKAIELPLVPYEHEELNELLKIFNNQDASTRKVQGKQRSLIAFYSIIWKSPPNNNEIDFLIVEIKKEEIVIKLGEDENIEKKSWGKELRNLLKKQNWLEENNGRILSKRFTLTK